MAKKTNQELDHDDKDEGEHESEALLPHQVRLSVDANLTRVKNNQHLKLKAETNDTMVRTSIDHSPEIACSHMFYVRDARSMIGLSFKTSQLLLENTISKHSVVPLASFSEINARSAFKWLPSENKLNWGGSCSLSSVFLETPWTPSFTLRTYHIFTRKYDDSLTLSGRVKVVPWDSLKLSYQPVAKLKTENWELDKGSLAIGFKTRPFGHKISLNVDVTAIYQG